MNTPDELVERPAALHQYFVVTKRGRLRKIDTGLIEAAFAGAEQVPNIDCGYLHLLSVVHDEADTFVGCYFLIVGVLGAYVADDSLGEAAYFCYLQGLHSTRMPEYEWYYDGIPDDWKAQIAKTIRVDESRIHDMGVGGPVLLSYMSRLPLAVAANVLAVYQWENRHETASGKLLPSITRLT